MSLRSDQAGELLRAQRVYAARPSAAPFSARSTAAPPSISLPTRSTPGRRSRYPISAAAPSTRRWRNSASWDSYPPSARPNRWRYETNTTQHSHFRCRLCLRIFDLLSGLQSPDQITDPGFSVERVDTRAEGICAECNDYNAGLKAGARAISKSGPAGDTLAARGVATATLDGPLGTLLLAATPHWADPRRV